MEHRTEEEQVAALKQWWKDNGNSLIIGVGLALALVFGWKMYQQNVENTKSAASALYQQLLEVALEPTATEETASSIEFIASKLKSEYEDTEYATFSALFLAKNAVGKKDLEGAEVELRWILANNPDSSLAPLVKGRLARVLDRQGKQEEAFALLDAKNAGTYAAIYLEIKGDIYHRAGDLENAKASYVEAYKAMKQAGVQRPMLTLKMADLGLTEEGA
ncbi:YfgM family protein [Alkalimarinus alittae]|uniref:Ancillary SecYEG translocon subunit n=1 Tax=Alkalimarinus alittae TaxID=2961619 RepID=A0ABY6N6I9_9ALTE|nr:tetratricopeptide repeat protein [Alkalimarinus alittae]UZE97716.1 tetratricopeptide repeat protein [Alkalimarinus alittae]